MNGLGSIGHCQSWFVTEREGCSYEEGPEMIYGFQVSSRVGLAPSSSLSDFPSSKPVEDLDHEMEKEPGAVRNWMGKR